MKAPGFNLNSLPRDKAKNFNFLPIPNDSTQQEMKKLHLTSSKFKIKTEKEEIEKENQKTSKLMTKIKGSNYCQVAHFNPKACLHSSFRKLEEKRIRDENQRMRSRINN